MNKHGDAFPIKVMVVIILIILVLVILFLFATGTYREIFETLSRYLGLAKDGAEALPAP
ncbi:MAG: hypothetical protein KJ767_03590 [Nanoarchaeota archaeon]|nr:hypothetical protein [Nanoarchaeota archaeon]